MLNTQDTAKSGPEVIVVGLASCFGCQLQITNMESSLLDILGQINLSYWQLASSEPMPSHFDVAVIEGAATTAEAKDTLKKIREEADLVITIGACAATGGIPGLATPLIYKDKANEIYGKNLPEALGELIVPSAVSDVIDVDYVVRCCPIDPQDFVDVLQKILHHSNRPDTTQTMCGSCKLNEHGCFYGRGILCLGLVTRGGCGARCPDRGRPCNGCAGISPDANISSAHAICMKSGIDPDVFDEALEMFNRANPDLFDVPEKQPVG